MPGAWRPVPGQEPGREEVGEEVGEESGEAGHGVRLRWGGMEVEGADVPHPCPSPAAGEGPWRQSKDWGGSQEVR